MIASTKGHSSVVRKLLQAGATVNTTNNVSNSLLEMTHTYCASLICVLFSHLDFLVSFVYTHSLVPRVQSTF